MPVPVLADSSSMAAPTDGSTQKAQGQPSQKTMTKAERRELQEKQRAAKAALKAQGGPAQPKAPKAAATPQKKAQPGETSKHGSLAGKDAAILMDGAAGGQSVSRSLRIFKHFGLPKPVSHVKGDIHPAIVRLGLLFSEFQICGANARCIATLSAFKTVCLHTLHVHHRGR
jgi:translation initiation factor eIF-2B subunit delta